MSNTLEQRIIYARYLSNVFGEILTNINYKPIYREHRINSLLGNEDSIYFLKIIEEVKGINFDFTDKTISEMNDVCNKINKIRMYIDHSSRRRNAIFN